MHSATWLHIVHTYNNKIHFTISAGHEGPDGRYKHCCTLPLISALYSWVINARFRPLYSVVIVQKAGWSSEPVWTDAGNRSSTGIRCLDRFAVHSALSQHMINDNFFYLFGREERRNLPRQLVIPNVSQELNSKVVSTLFDEDVCLIHQNIESGTRFWGSHSGVEEAIRLFRIWGWLTRWKLRDIFSIFNGWTLNLKAEIFGPRLVNSCTAPHPRKNIIFRVFWCPEFYKC